jgi:hypothetical protein
MKKKLLFLNLFMLSTFLFSQDKSPYNFGRITQNDFDMNFYEKDSSANAVFLNEYGKTHFQDTDNGIIIRTKYYAKIKIFNKEGENNATVSIPIRNTANRSESVTKVRAITHNGIVKTSLDKKNIYTEKVDKRWSVVKFTMPNIKSNSIIEYEYTFETPFYFNFKGWEFQADIPKIYSEFYSLIPGNFTYNRGLRGTQNLVKNNSDIKKNCFSVRGIAKQADCEELIYAMSHVPAFIEEDYMTTRENYLSAIKFELSKTLGFDGVKHSYTKSWKDVDSEFKTEKSIGKQLKKISALKKLLPERLLQGENTLEKAKKIYYFIQGHFTWNNKSRVFSEVNVKEAYSKKVGNSTEINIALINAYIAAGFDAEIMLISTRNNGLPTKLYPVMTDFNYAIAKLNIDENNYLLDATNKLLPFSTLPYRVLNSYGRVMNFKKGSYWHEIHPKKNNNTLTTLNLTLNEEGDFKGIMHQSYNGYRAISKRKEIKTEDEDVYLTEIEDAYNGDASLVIDSYQNTNLDSIEKPLKELFNITIESSLNGKYLLINPFVIDKISVNPFKLKQRTYPIDFGYPRTFQYTLKLKIPQEFKIKELPEKMAFSLPNKGGVYIFSVQQKNNEISLISRMSIKRYFFLPEEYPYLKEFYNQIIKTQKSLITLEKIN